MNRIPIVGKGRASSPNEPSACERLVRRARPTCTRKKKSGFSLLEVLVALAIFGIAAGGVLVALGHHLKNVSFLQDHSRAVRIASREMNALRRMKSLPEEEKEGAEDRFIWVSQVNTDGLDEWPGLDSSTGTPVRLSVTVQWSDSEGGPSAGKVHLDGFEVIGTAK
ncbi:MAG: prepilin-type N-terminal cleavage/methylation domain-containing protein [Kiritimatiellales bacterium]